MAKKPKTDTPEGDGMDDLGRPMVPEGLALYDPNDANDQKAFDAAKKEETARRRGDDLVLQDLMATTGGRDWMYRLLDRCHIYSVGADLGTADRNCDALATYFMCGERNIGNQILIDVQRSDPSAYLTMISEQNEKKAQRDG